MGVEEVENENEPGCQQRLIAVYDVGGIQRPAGQEAREKRREPQHQARQTDDHDAPEYREIVEFLPVGPAIASRLFAQVGEVANVREVVPDVLGLRHHRVGSPQQPVLVSEQAAEEQVKEVEGHVTERAYRSQPVYDSREVQTAEQVYQLLCPDGVVELQWQAGQCEQQEGRDDHDVHADVHGIEPSDIFAVTVVVVAEFAA